MTRQTPTRDEALKLLTAYNGSQSLVNHGLAVEAVMRHMARKHDENEEKWGIIGLIHDLDYEAFPDEHCAKTREILEEHDWPDEYIRAAISHAYGICSDVEPQSLLEKTLYAVDELTGFIAACALVRPSKSIMDLTVKSVRKKWKQKHFAAGVNREVIENGARMLDADLNDLILDTITGMQDVADEIGLKGST